MYNGPGLPWRSGPSFAAPEYVPESTRPAPPRLVAADGSAANGVDRVVLEDLHDQEIEKSALDLMTLCFEAVTALLTAQQQSAQQQGRKNIIGLKIDQTLPLLKDSDSDFEGHWRQFQSVLECYGKCGAQLSSYETLIMYRRGLPNGSIRIRTFDNELKKARNRNRLPDDVANVSLEFWGKLAELLKESDFQRKGRLDKEMAELHMGKKTHSEFRIAWEELTEHMRQAEMLPRVVSGLTP